jgi:hypothetical protein
MALFAFLFALAVTYLCYRLVVWADAPSKDHHRDSTSTAPQTASRAAAPSPPCTPPAAPE